MRQCELKYWEYIQGRLGNNVGQNVVIYRFDKKNVDGDVKCQWLKISVEKGNIKLSSSCLVLHLVLNISLIGLISWLLKN